MVADAGADDRDRGGGPEGVPALVTPDADALLVALQHREDPDAAGAVVAVAHREHELLSLLLFGLGALSEAEARQLVALLEEVRDATCPASRPAQPACAAVGGGGWAI